MQAIVSADAKLARAVSHDRRCIRLASFSARGQWEPGEARTSWAGGSSTGPKTDQGPGCLNAPAREPERQYGAAPCGGASELAEQNLLCARPRACYSKKVGGVRWRPHKRIAWLVAYRRIALARSVTRITAQQAQMGHNIGSAE